MIFDFEEEREAEVLVRETLVKETSVFGAGEHACVETEYDATEGRRVAVTHMEPDGGDLSELFAQQQRSALQVIRCCERLCRQLLADGHRRYAGLYIAGLKEECEGWERDELIVDSR